MLHDKIETKGRIPHVSSCTFFLHLDIVIVLHLCLLDCLRLISLRLSAICDLNDYYYDVNLIDSKRSIYLNQIIDV